MLRLFAVVPPSSIPERHSLARAGILFSYAFGPELVIYPRTRFPYHQLHGDTPTAAVVVAVIVQRERGTLCNARRWRHRICEFCGSGSSSTGTKWDCGYRNHAGAATLARKCLRRSHR